MNRTIAPEFSKAQNIDLVFPKKFELTNHIDLYHLSEVQDDTIKLDIVWPAGSKYQAKSLTASFTNALLLAGTEKSMAKEISENIDFQGGYVSHDIDKDQAAITLYGLNDKIEVIFDIFTTSFDKAIFPKSEVEKLIDIRKNGFNISMEKVSTLCRQSFNQNDLIAFYDDFYKNSKPTLFLVGNADESFIDKIKIWASTLGTKTPEVKSAPIKQTKGRIELKKEGAIQTSIRIGNLMIQKDHADYYKFQILNTIFGGYFGSRLMANIREDKGYTYGIGSGLSVLDDAAYFFISTEVGKEVTENTITEIFVEIDKLKTDLITDDELEKVKNYLLGEFLRQADGSIAMMENFKNIFFNNLDKTYYSNYIKAINEVTPKELIDLANKYWTKENMLIVTAG
jgi:predicted Zn-dependent peptidase